MVVLVASCDPMKESTVGDSIEVIAPNLLMAVARSYDLMCDGMLLKTMVLSECISVFASFKVFTLISLSYSQCLRSPLLTVETYFCISNSTIAYATPFLVEKFSPTWALLK